MFSHLDSTCKRGMKQIMFCIINIISANSCLVSFYDLFLLCFIKTGKILKDFLFCLKKKRGLIFSGDGLGEVCSGRTGVILKSFSPLLYNFRARCFQCASSESKLDLEGIREIGSVYIFKKNISDTSTPLFSYFYLQPHTLNSYL